jgi:O-antigen ligase
MLFYSLLILAALGFFALSYYRPLWALYAIAGLLPTYGIRFQLLGIPLTWLEIMILLLVVVVVIKKEFDFKKIKEDYFFWPIVAILIFATISIVTSPATISALGIWKAYFIEPILYYWLMILLIKERRQIEGVFWALGTSVIYLSLIGIWQKFSAWKVPLEYLNADGSVDRIVSVYSYPNALGLYLGPIIVLFLGFLFYKNQDSLLLYLGNIKRFWFKLAVVVLGFLTIFLAQSEGAVLAVLVCGWLLFLVNKKTRWPVLIISALSVIIFLFNEPVKEFVLIKIMLKDWSGIVRRAMWSETWEMLKVNWLWGAGLAGYQLKIIPYHVNEWFSTFPYPHNSLFNFWSELGLLGLLSFIWLGIKFILINLKNIFSVVCNYTHNLGFDKIASFVFLLVGLEIFIHGLVDAPYFKNDLSVLFWILMGATTLNIRLKSKFD